MTDRLASIAARAKGQPAKSNVGGDVYYAVKATHTLGLRHAAAWFAGEN